MENLIQSYVGNTITFSKIDWQVALTNAKQKTAQQLIDSITQSGLRGCGGAGFPVAQKWAFLAKESGLEKYVMCNADEGEPGTFKDRYILTNHAELVFAGMSIAAQACQATHGILYLRAEYAYLVAHLEAVLTKMQLTLPIQLKLGAGAYVCGEETALIESAEGKRGEPRVRPPYPIQQGYLNKPTLVQNVETLAWVAAIISESPEWFNSAGTSQSKGFKLFSVSGDCEKPGIYEFPFGITINHLLQTVGASSNTKAVLAGGASGQLIGKSGFARKFAFEDAPANGSIIIFSEQHKIIDILENVISFFTEESCGKCFPCRLGTEQLKMQIAKIVSKKKCSEDDLNFLLEIGAAMKISSLCGLGQSVNNILASSINYFRNELISKR
jgi:[NiFe] hydrogenase diaphorase moiety large subunit